MRGCKLYVTYRSEYLVLRDLCVGVRDRASGAWIPLHAAACAHVLGPANATDTPLIPSPVRVGEQMCLQPALQRVITGPIVSIEEPTPKLMREAERRWQALFQPSDPRDSVILLEPRDR
ncbi:MAG: hypothetical protein ABW321_34025 [Polyangiales bacterium]